MSPPGPSRKEATPGKCRGTHACPAVTDSGGLAAKGAESWGAGGRALRGESNQRGPALPPRSGRVWGGAPRGLDAAPAGGVHVAIPGSRMWP